MEKRIYEICRTGDLKQFYTLYEVYVVREGHCFFEEGKFIQNLSFDKEDAIAKAKEIGKGLDIRYEVITSTKREYCKLGLFGLSWKKTEKGFIADPDGDFWDIYKAHKSALKEIGLSVFKDDSGNFRVFFKNRSNEQLVIDLEKFEEFKKAPEIGNYISIDNGPKITGVNGVVTSVKAGENQFGSFQKIIFVVDGCRCMAYFTGKKSYQIGDTIKSFIIKDFDVIDGVKTTIVKNIK